MRPVRQHDVPEEVVRREEREVAAEIAVALHDVVDLLRHVLLVTREDDEVVELREVVARRELLEVFVGEVVRLLARVHEEAQEPALQRAVVRRLPRVEVRPSERDVVPLRIAVPRVGLAVAVRVVEVVGLPRVGRQHDRDAIDSRHGRAQDERRERDGPAARRRQPREVEAALPRAGPDDQRVHVAAAEPPLCGGPHGRPTLLQPRSAPARMNCSSSRFVLRADDQPGGRARRVRGRGERRRQRRRRPLARSRGSACGDDRRGDGGATGGCHAGTEQIRMR